jgi:hypothetical protein
VALKGFFPKADTAKVEVTHKTARTTALKTTSNFARRELRLEFGFVNEALFGHILYI